MPSEIVFQPSFTMNAYGRQIVEDYRELLIQQRAHLLRHEILYLHSVIPQGIHGSEEMGV